MFSLACCNIKGEFFVVINGLTFPSTSICAEIFGFNVNAIVSWLFLDWLFDWLTMDSLSMSLIWEINKMFQNLDWQSHYEGVCETYELMELTYNWIQFLPFRFTWMDRPVSLKKYFFFSIKLETYCCIAKVGGNTENEVNVTHSAEKIYNNVIRLELRESV